MKGFYRGPTKIERLFSDYKDPMSAYEIVKNFVTDAVVPKSGIAHSIRTCSTPEELEQMLNGMYLGCWMRKAMSRN